jgi:hypothetical protein
MENGPPALSSGRGSFPKDASILRQSFFVISLITQSSLTSAIAVAMAWPSASIHTS